MDKNNKRIYLTTPIYYVNSKPHIGHAYTTILTDAFARAFRFLGNEVYFLTGTDEHGEKIDKTARANNQTPQEFVDQIVPRFKALWETLGVKYDDFIRTTEKRHTTVVQKVIENLHAKGDIYKGTYRGWYCTPCETFWTALQLVDGKCPDCHRAVHELAEDNYFFKMSQYQQWLVDYIKAHDGFIRPKAKENEVLGFLKEPLADLCISRPKSRLSWGIPVPFDPDHVLYVWFDALVNYISAAGYLSDEKKFASLWPATVHFMAKDILRQHAVYWPIMLHAMDLELPKCVLAHGFWTMEGQKMSKSVGNVADPHEVIQLYGIDTLKYFLLKEVPLGTDGAYADEYVASRFNTDLANDLGNLVHRSFSMLEKYRGGVLPETHDAAAYREIIDRAGALAAVMQKEIAENLAPRNVLVAIWDVIGMANRLVEEKKPWTLAKDPAKKDELDTFLYVLIEVLRMVGVAITPFMPATAAKICAMMQISPAVTISDLVWGVLRPGVTLQKGEPLFPKIEEEK